MGSYGFGSYWNVDLFQKKKMVLKMTGHNNTKITMNEQIERIFPRKINLPENIDLPFPIEQSQYLMNGYSAEKAGT